MIAYVGTDVLYIQVRALYKLLYKGLLILRMNSNNKPIHVYMLSLHSNIVHVINIIYNNYKSFLLKLNNFMTVDYVTTLCLMNVYYTRDREGVC